MAEETGYTEYSADSPLRYPLKFIKGIVSDIFRLRELVWSLFLRDLRAQFRQSLLGYIWLLFPPLATAGLWLILQSQRILQVETEVPYPIFILIGTTIWTSFVNMVSAPLAGFNSGKSIYTKLNVPHEAFVASSVLRVLLNFLIRLVVVVPAFIFFKYVPPATAFLFPVAVVMLFMVAIAVGIWMIPIGSLYGDIGNFLPNVLQIFMYFAPVIYPIGLKTGWFRDAIMMNPVTPGIALSRDLVTTGSFEWWIPTMIIGGVSFLLTVFAVAFLRLAKPHLVARMGM